MPLTGHPRLFITPSTLATVRSRCSTGGEMLAEYQALINYVESNYGVTWRTSGLPDERGIAHASACGFIAQIGFTTGITPPVSGHTTADFAADGIRVLLDAAANCPATASVFDRASRSPALGLAWDWLFESMSVGDRTTIGTWYAAIWASMKGAPNWNGNWADDNDYVYRTLPAIMGAACVGDGYLDTEATEMVAFRDAGGLFGDGTLATKSNGQRGTMDMLNWYMGGTGLTPEGWGGGYHQGMNYGQHGPPQSGLWLLHAMEATRTYEDITKSAWYNGTRDAFFRSYLAYRWRRVHPYPPSSQFWIKNTLTDHGQSEINGVAGATNSSVWATIFQSIYNGVDADVAGFSAWYRANYTGYLSTVSAKHYYYPLWISLGKGTSVTQKSPVDLGWSKTQKDSVYENGCAFLTDLTGSDRTHVQIDGHRVNARGTWHSGHYNIDRMGPLTIHKGSRVHHRGLRGGSTAVDRGCSNTWYGANCVGFFDAANINNDNFTATDSDMGGQRISNTSTKHYNQFTSGSVYDLCEMVYFEPAVSNIPVDYVMYDLTRTYQGSPNTGTISPINKLPVNSNRNFSRSFVFIRGADRTVSDFLVVLDRIQANTARNWEMRRLLQVPGGSGCVLSVDNGSLQTGTPVRNGSGTGRDTYTTASQVTLTNTTTGGYNGKMWTTLITPTAADIVLVNTGQTVSSGGVGGQNLENPLGIQEAEDIASYATIHFAGDRTLEFIPQTAGTSQQFFMVHEIGLSTFSKSTTQKLTSTNFIVAQMGQNIVGLSATETAQTSGTFVVPSPGTYHLFLADLTPNTDYVVDYGIAQIGGTSTDSGTLYVNILPASSNQTVTVGLGTPTPPSTAGSYYRLRKTN